MNQIVSFDSVSYAYDEGTVQEVEAICDISLRIAAGAHVAILGRNGSGKSTAARLINALLVPRTGTVTVAGFSPSDDDAIFQIRRRCGMVFQNPDNQIVGTTVEEDVAFGPENLGMDREQMHKVVTEVLRTVGLESLSTKAPSELSGGQKQKLAIAGALAMRPRLLILDEATAMLDPESAADFLSLVESLRKTNGLTVVNITHNMEEVLIADYVYVIDAGQVALQGVPEDVFDNIGEMRSLGLDVPRHIEIAEKIAVRTGRPLKSKEAFHFEEAIEAVRARLFAASAKTDRTVESDNASDVVPDSSMSVKKMRENDPGEKAAERKSAGKTAPTAVKSLQTESFAVCDRNKSFRYGDELIKVEGLSYSYEGKGGAKALDSISFSVKKGELFGLVGHSGSGKSTLIQHLNGLIRPEKKTVTVFGLDAGENKNIREIRQRLGLLFQYPEHQLFEETVAKDIAFGLQRQKLSDEEIRRKVEMAAAKVGLDKSILDRSPFDLSGGQKRRAAIAGILVMEPDVLVLDEPAAGLDPAGRDGILADILRLRDTGVTILIVSHNMDEIAAIADKILVLRQGKVHQYGTPAEIFSDEAKLLAAGLKVPRTKRFLQAFCADYPDLDTSSFSVDSAVAALIQAAETLHGG